MSYYRKFNKKPKQTVENTQFQPTIEYLQSVCSQSYIGKKGYTIPKSILKKEDEEFLKKELFLKPEIKGSFLTNEESVAFPVYRENTNKIYIPRFYGISRYGLPSKTDIEPGDNIQLSFDKPLRDYQDKIINVYMQHVNTPIVSKPSIETESSPINGNGGILEVPCGRGKCLGRDTKILMYDGTIKNVQDINVGDKLMGDDSTPRTVLTLARGKEQMAKICEIETNEYYKVNMSHILSLKNIITEEIVDISVKEYLQHPEKDNLFGFRVPIEFSEKKVSEPYLYGYRYDKFNDINCFKYICNSRKNRLELLAGFVDQMHSTDRYVYRFCLPPNNMGLLRKIRYLCRSLGFHISVNCTETEISIDLRSTKYVNLNEIPTCIVDLDWYNLTALSYETLQYKIEVQMLETDDYYGFEIDGNRRFVLYDFIVTHNTVMALKIISLLGKKTLIIVHKEFLMNQWMERIEEFLPGARVGKIQGPLFDIENKDIVIGMIQTMYDKDYSSNAFSSFGLTIIDEVHRIGSEQFSKTLFKAITPYMLGISATVERKDKLTKVLYMFIGDKIYTEQRKDDDVVCVRAIQYSVDDEVFNETEMDFRGNPKYSTMITKLCEYNRRSEFIIRVLKDLIDEEPDNQIMVLCHNRSLLKYLYEGIEHRKFASVGYYVGGMKQSDLQDTESKEIVLATYAMAAEALDIKSLSTLVMVTPKTDIVQSVGRILRVKHEKPIIVDIVDSHDIFQNQWVQRRRYYKKCNYRIRQIESKNYTNMNVDWDNDTTWKRVFEPNTKNKVECEYGSITEDVPKCMISLDGF